MILRMSVAWTSGHMRQLIGDVIKVICLICGLTVAAVVAGYFFGLPILSWIYHRSDLNPFGSELTLLLISGGFIALSGFLTTVLTIMRRQRPMMIGFLLSAAVGLTANWWVSTGGLLGACLLNISLFAIQVLILGVVVIVTVGKRLHHV